MLVQDHAETAPSPVQFASIWCVKESRLTISEYLNHLVGDKEQLRTEPLLRDGSLSQERV